MMCNRSDDQPVEFLVFLKGGQSYVFAFTIDTVRPLKRTFTKFAQDPELDFSWCDADLLCRKVREMINTPQQQK